MDKLIKEKLILDLDKSFIDPKITDALREFSVSQSFNIVNEISDQTVIDFLNFQNVQNQALEKLLSITGDLSKDTLKYLFNTRPLNINISCPGGSVYSGFALYDLLKNSPFRTVGKASGIVASMAVPIFLGCKEKLAYSNTTFMIHQLSCYKWDYLQKILEDVEEMKRLQYNIDRIITENTSITENMLEKVYSKKQDWYFDSHRAKELNLIDSII